MQPVGGPVGRQVAAVTPDRTDLVSAHGLPDLPALADVLVGEHHLALRGRDHVGLRRSNTINLTAHQQQDRKRRQQDAGEHDP
jgi:hypothetical protein